MHAAVGSTVVVVLRDVGHDVVVDAVGGGESLVTWRSCVLVGRSCGY